MKTKQSLIGEFNGPGRLKKLDSGQEVRPDVKVALGAGIIKEIKETDSNIQVIMNVEGAKWPYSGFINKVDPIVEVIRKAHELGAVVIMRFERKRNSKADPLASIDDLTASMDIAKENIVKMASGIYDINGEKWLLSGEAEVNPAEDPAWVSSKINSLIYDSVAIEGFFDAPTVSKPNVNPYVNDRANALLTMYYFVKELEVKYDFELKDSGRRQIAENLLMLTDLLQVGVFSMNGPNHKDYSHTKARFMLFKWEEFNNLTADEIKNLNNWGQAFLKESIEIWKWTLQSSTPKETSNK